MTNGFERYQKDLDRLEKKGAALTISMQKEHFPKEYSEEQTKRLGFDKLPTVDSEYEVWYSEALALVKQLLPDRADDFTAYYKPKAARKEITYANYTISDALRGLIVSQYGETKVSPSAAFKLLYQQFNIIQGLKHRFVSTLFDIKTLVQADLLDDELHTADELNSKGFQRGAGAVAGVVLEGHLASVCQRHSVSLKKKDPAISDLNDALKAADVLETATWRFIQHLARIMQPFDQVSAGSGIFCREFRIL